MDLENVYRRINNVIGNDYKNLPKCQDLCELLNKEKKQLESELHVTCAKFPKKLSDIDARVEEVQSKIQEFLKKLEIFLEVQEDDELENYFEKLALYNKKKNEYFKSLHYFKTLKIVEVTNFNIKKYYSESNWYECVFLYVSLCSLLDFIYNSPYQELVKYIKEVLQYWHKLLKIKLIEEYEQLLKAINWPFVVRDKAIPAHPSEELKPKFQQLTRLLLEVELPDLMRIKPTVTSALTVDFPPPSLPVFLVLEPIRKRFLFHFRGSKETNRPDKPEWMFTQILTWIKDHELFLMEWLQPIYSGFVASVKIEFTRGLVKMVTEKLRTDLMQLQYDDYLFTHTLNETLDFHRELTQNYGYPSSCASVLSVLTQAQIFVKWINMERKCAEKRMDDMLNSDSAWIVITEDDKCKVTECGDKFIILLSSITDRYSSLPQPGHRLQFLDFQLDLIDEFRLRLAQLKKEDYSDVLDSDLPSILNTIHYLGSILTEWGANTHFLMLHHFKEQLKPDERRISISVFDDIVDLMNHFSDELTKEICTSVALEISAKSRSYRKDRWNILPPMDPGTELGLTLSGCAMFQLLTSKLHQMQKVIAPEIFKNCWRYLADHLCYLIIDDVILVNMFSKGGAQQIQFDVKRNILPLFAQFTAKPEAYFKPLIEACDLLCSDITVTSETVPFKITALTKLQVESILNRKAGKSFFDLI